MTRAELIERIVDSFYDMSGENPEDYLGMEPINLVEATEYLAQERSDEDACDLSDDERLPAEVTPELYMEAENCFIRLMQHQARIAHLAEWLTDTENVCIHNQYFHEYENSDPEVLPMEFLCVDTVKEFPFPTGANDDLMLSDILMIGYNSRKTFNPDDDYCWYDKEKMQLFSADFPFHDEVIDATALATYALSPEGKECLEEVLGQMGDAECKDCFGCTSDEVRKLYHLS